MENQDLVRVNAPIADTLGQDEEDVFAYYDSPEFEAWCERKRIAAEAAVKAKDEAIRLEAHRAETEFEAALAAIPGGGQSSAARRIRAAVQALFAAQVALDDHEAEMDDW